MHKTNMTKRMTVQDLVSSMAKANSNSSILTTAYLFDKLGLQTSFLQFESAIMRIERGKSRCGSLPLRADKRLKKANLLSFALVNLESKKVTFEHRFTLVQCGGKWHLLDSYNVKAQCAPRSKPVSLRSILLQLQLFMRHRTWTPKTTDAYTKLFNVTRRDLESSTQAIVPQFVWMFGYSTAL